jgi:phospholipase C
MVNTTRREILRTGVAAGGVAALSAFGRHPLVQRALAASPAGCGRLSDIEHVVIFVQENRSFDSYFGSYRGVRGFADPGVLALRDGSGLGVFAQPGYGAPGYGGHLYPFHLDTNANGECTNDITHDWGPQHHSWNGGAMDGFVKAHLAAEGPSQGPVTMGYYRRPDLPFYYALADAFTLCDGYHCSALGPTDPNQLYIASAWLGQDGEKGGPVVETFGSNRVQKYGSLSWTTMPEQLQARGITWKVYSADNASPEEDPAFPFFAQYHSRPELTRNGLAPTYPADFMADIANGALPQVSWVYTTIAQSEHPPAPVTYGESVASQIVSALVAQPDTWRRTALLITWDENGGFFDHVPPPTPEPGTKGEYLTSATLPAAAQGIRGPIGLGFRVPLLIVSPFARGGNVCSDTFDHTSLLRLIETRFGAEVPNLTEWRRAAVGDLTSALNLAAVDAGVPTLPTPSVADKRVIDSDCATEPATLAPGAGPALPGYAVPPNAMPGQEPGAPRRPSGSYCRSATPTSVTPTSVTSGGGALRVTIAHLPRGCARGGLRALVTVSHSAQLRSVKVHLNGRTILTTRRARFGVPIRVGQLHRGHNRIAVIARDAEGRFVVAVAHFRRCTG